MQVANLTKRSIESEDAAPKDKDFFLWCGKTPGFGLRVYPTGKRIFVAQVRVGRSIRRVKIGPFGPLTVEDARQRAKRIIGTAVDGRDPQREKRERRDALTVAELCQHYLEAVRAGLVVVRRFKRAKRASTVAIDEGRIARHIVPLIGSIRVCDLTRQDVQKMVDDIAAGKTAGVFKGKPRGKAVVTGGAGTAARVVELLGGIWTWAEARGHVAERSSPVRGVERTRGEPRTRVLDEETELRALGYVLAKAQADAEAKARRLAERHRKALDPATPLPPPAAVAVTRLVALSGWRRTEWSSLQWAAIDWTGHCIRLSDTKNGRSNRAVGKAVLRYLTQLAQAKTSDKWVFPNRHGTGSADVKKDVGKLFKAAGLDGRSRARSHDLRRTLHDRR
jgi:Arm DNA-binding domain/Phage integrase family